MDGKKLHVDASLIEADAAKESVIKAAPPLIAALKQAYRATESKLEETSSPESFEAVNDRHDEPEHAQMQLACARAEVSHDRAINITG